MSDLRTTNVDEADRWVIRLASDQHTAKDDEDFRAWLETDPRNAHAYAESAAVFAGVGALSGDDEAEAFLREAVAAPAHLDRRALLGAGLGLGGAAAAAAVVLPLRLDRRTYRTRPGEQRSVVLADGSSLLLDADTSLQVKLTADERRIWLVRGQAFFRVAKDRRRPFRVFVGQDEVRALGTAFDVRRIGDTARVTLEEGRVAVYRATASAPGASVLDPAPASTARDAPPVAVLAPGQQLALGAPAARVAAVDLRKTGAWRYGRLILDDAALGETVADLNRYGGARIILADPQLETLRVSGVFHTGRPDAFVESVVAAFPVRIIRQTPDEIVLDVR